MKYFKTCGLFGAGRPIGIFDLDEVLQGLWPITWVHVALLSCNNRISATEILTFDKYLFSLHISLGYISWGLIKTFKVKPSLGKKTQEGKRVPLTEIVHQN
jgi:hypothetical protein